MLMKKLEDSIINYSRVIAMLILTLALFIFIFYSFSFASIFFDEANYKGIESPVFIEKKQTQKNTSNEKYDSNSTVTHFNKSYYVINEHAEKINNIINLIYPVYVKSGYTVLEKKVGTLEKLNKSFIKNYQQTITFLEKDKHFSVNDDKTRNKILDKYIEDFLVYAKDWSKFYMGKNDISNSGVMEKKYKLEVIKIIATGGPIKIYNTKYKKNVLSANYDYSKSQNLVKNNKKSLLEIVLYISISFGIFITAILYILFFRIDESLRIKKG